MSEVIVYRSKIEQATDTALFELMSAEWMFPSSWLSVLRYFSS